MKKIILRKVPYLILMISVVLFTGACSSSEEERIIQRKGSGGTVKSAVESGALTIHGLWNDIGEGNVEYYDEKKKKFISLNKH